MADDYIIVTKENIFTFKNKNVRLEKNIININEALKRANDLEQDLIVVNKNIDPPIVKILDYQKYLYEQKKRAKESAKKQKANIQKLKEVKFHLNIGKNDFNYKINHIKEFINDNCKVKCQIFLRGREQEFEDLINELQNNILESCKDFADLIDKPVKQGNTINFMFVKHKPKK